MRRKNYNTNTNTGVGRKDYNTNTNTGVGRNKYITNTGDKVQIDCGTKPLNVVRAIKEGQTGKLYHLVTFSFTKWKVCYQHLERKVSKSWSLDAKINFIKFPQAQIQPATNPI